MINLRFRSTGAVRCRDQPHRWIYQKKDHKPASGKYQAPFPCAIEANGILSRGIFIFLYWNPNTNGRNGAMTGQMVGRFGRRKSFGGGGGRLPHLEKSAGSHTGARPRKCRPRLQGLRLKRRVLPLAELAFELLNFRHFHLCTIMHTAQCTRTGNKFQAHYYVPLYDVLWASCNLNLRSLLLFIKSTRSLSKAAFI